MTDNPTEPTALLYNNISKPKWSFGDRCKPTKIFRRLKMFLLYIFTDWPWETVRCISEVTRKDTEVPLSPTVDDQQQQATRQQQAAGQQLHQGDAEPAEPPQDERTRYRTALWFMLAFLRLLFIIAAIFAQLMSCFRRDRISTDLIPIDIAKHPNYTSLLKCNDTSETISGLLIPDGIIILVAIWVYFGLRFGHQYRMYAVFGEWKEMKTVMKAATAERLNALIQDVKSKLQKKSIISCYTVIPLMYIALSQVTSGIYLVAFRQLTNKTVAIQPPLGKQRLYGAKLSIIPLSFVGFISLDLLYLCVMMRYGYRCQLIIYYLQIIKQEVKHLLRLNNEEGGGNEDNQLEDRRSRSHQEIMEKVTKAHKYIKELNANSATTGFVILIATYQIINCAIMLLDKNITYLIAAALLLRFTLWGFLAMFPFKKAAEVNIASRKLCETGLDMHRPNNGMVISLKARMFGTSVNPWSPYVVVILLLLILTVGSNYKWFVHVVNIG